MFQTTNKNPKKYIRVKYNFCSNLLFIVIKSNSSETILHAICYPQNHPEDPEATLRHTLTHPEAIPRPTLTHPEAILRLP
jgi:hypothetical protein